MSLKDEKFYEYDSDGDEYNIIDEIDYALLNITLPKKRNETEEYYFKILCTYDIVHCMMETIREANSFVGLSETTTRILLNHFKWDIQQFVCTYYNGDQEKLFKEAHIINPFKTRSLTSSQPSSNEADKCQVCLVEIPKNMMTGLGCGHQFCEDCWNEYLKIKIMDEGIVQAIQCAANSCDILVDYTNIMRLVKEPKVKQKYEHLISNDFVECHKLIKWCPKGCENAIMVKNVEAKPVKCKCNYTFCFLCGANWHDPIKCDLLRKWSKHCKEDLDSDQWILKNAKNCPHCDAPIEKNEGCMHMTCRNRNCGYEFCWLCMGSWTHAHRCNRFDEIRAQSKQEANQKKAMVLQKYNFFSNRYMNHMQSLKFENQLHRNILDKMKETQQQYDMTWNEVCFLQKAVDVLISCRQTLMYTYVLAFYLEKNNQTEIFQDNQNDLENAVEVLSGYLERDITVNNVAQFKPKIQDTSKYCNNRRIVLLEHVQEGNDKKWWVFVDF
ncbi:E3 ubiquitin-protein ligase arih1-like [Phymastichus coffea]|uniref:E3 ubiquitin-protein ligase arih1-like n=1 Tax=Phymastichus coffea TaxID=108790 RepID=UPI00273C6455|nr:E3 ubiquitin-protein ligase arih1-like [Phymastichus coffea]XP_058795297.1 E3 ubiquitin-protein ligase arih1-like [Phymastichus coffea]